MSRPAGFSDDEDDSDFESFGFEPVRRNHANRNIQERVLTPQEKLFEAVRKNDVTAVAAAIAEGADVHYRLKDNSPIMEAAAEGHFDVLELLIQNGANVNDDHNMTTVLMCLCTSWSKSEEELLRCMRLLLEHGANPRATNWTTVTPIMMATRSNHILLVSHLLEIGCDVNAPDPDGVTPLMLAVQNENLAMVKLLLDSGADRKAMDRRGNALQDLPQVGSNPDLAALLGIKLQDDTPVEVHVPQSIFKRTMALVPKKNDRLYGYHEDAVHFVKGIGLYDVSKILAENDFQFAQLLTWNDEDWDRAGIHISYYKKRISLSAKKFLEHPWGKGATPKVSSVVSRGQVDLFLVVLFFFDFLRVMHITSATSLYVKQNFDGRLSPEAKRAIENTLLDNLLARRHLQYMKKMCARFESAANSFPPDLISEKKEKSLQKHSGLCVQFVKFVFKCYVYWRMPQFSN